jgi:hypothetical protein
MIIIVVLILLRSDFVSSPLVYTPFWNHLMYKFNGSVGAILCDVCRIIILEPATESLADREDLCSSCIRNSKCPECFFNPCKCQEINKWLEEHKELMQDMIDKGD